MDHDKVPMVFFERLVAGVTCLLVGLAALYAVSYTFQFPRVWLFLALLTVVGGLAARPHLARLALNTPAPLFLLTIGAFILVTRAAWVAAVPTLPDSDFAVYHNSASAIAAGRMELPKVHRAGYPLLLGAVYRLFGTDISVGQSLNVALSALCAPLVYLITWRLFGAPAAWAATLLFALWPAQLMYTSVLASDLPYMTLILAALALFLDALTQRDNKWYRWLGVGVLLGLSHPIRPFSALLLVVLAIWLWLSLRRPATRLTLYTMLLALGFVLVFIPYQLLHVRYVGPSISAALFPVDNLLAGTNVLSKGQWNIEDSRLSSELVTNFGPNEGARLIRQMAVQRVMADPITFSSVVFEKFSTVWSDEPYGFWWALNKTEETALAKSINARRDALYAVSQYFHIVVLSLCVAGCYTVWQTCPNRHSLLLMLIFLAIVGVHVIAEAQQRFHYPWQPLFIVLAGYGVMHSFTKSHAIRE